jgi:hypothetical protein
MQVVTTSIRGIFLPSASEAANAGSSMSSAARWRQVCQPWNRTMQICMLEGMWVRCTRYCSRSKHVQETVTLTAA